MRSYIVEFIVYVWRQCNTLINLRIFGYGTIEIKTNQIEFIYTMMRIYILWIPRPLLTKKKHGSRFTLSLERTSKFWKDRMPKICIKNPVAIVIQWSKVRQCTSHPLVFIVIYLYHLFDRKGDITKLERVISPIRIGDIILSKRWYHLLNLKGWYRLFK